MVDGNSSNFRKQEWPKITNIREQLLRKIFGPKHEQVGNIT
jgi:hypothetical protein